MTTSSVASTGQRVPLSRPDITDLEREYVLRVLETPFLSQGPELARFEEELAACAGVPHAVAVSSGTAALHLSVLALGLKPGDEVITTPFSFIASANCLLFEGVSPVFADIDPVTLALDPDAAEQRIGPRTRAILAVDVFGHPAAWDRLEALADKHGLALIEDAAEAIGATYQGRSAGGFGDAAVFAFYPNKQVTTGEGGALLTKHAEVADMARSLRNQGRGIGDGWLQHERLGYNYRLSDLNCALGRAQLKRLPELLEARARVATRYTELLGQVPGIDPPVVDPAVTHMSWFVYVARLSQGRTGAERDEIIRILREQGVDCSNYFPSIHLSPVYRQRWGHQEGDYPVSEDVSQRTIALPFFGALTDGQIRYVVDVVRDAVARV